MISRAEYIRAALARARSWVDDHPYAGPELVEAPPIRAPRKPACKNGHEEAPRYKDGRCVPCVRARDAASRALP